MSRRTFVKSTFVQNSKASKIKLPELKEREGMMKLYKYALQTAFVLSAVFVAGIMNANAQVEMKFILDWKYQGQMGMYFLAADRGYFEEEGLDVSFDQGEGAGAAAPKIASGAYDIGFGSLSSVIQLHATNPEEAPVAVFQTYSRSPLVIAIRNESPIQEPEDLEGKTIAGPVFDGARKLFPTFANLTGIDASKVDVSNIAPNLRAQMLVRGDIDGAFGFYTAFLLDTKLLGANPEEDLRFIRYEDYGMDLYSNAIIVSRALLEENPEAVEGFIRALNRGLKDSYHEREAAVEAVLEREPLLKPEIERERLDLMFSFDMSAPEVKEHGVGDVLDQRLKRNINIVVEANDLPRSPSPSEVFDRSFLPPVSERLKPM